MRENYESSKPTKIIGSEKLAHSYRIIRLMTFRKALIDSIAS